jgi:hypothetical protein
MCSTAFVVFPRQAMEDEILDSLEKAREAPSSGTITMRKIKSKNLKRMIRPSSTES